MIHVNLSSARPGSRGFDGTLAHEFQHMVHWHREPGQRDLAGRGLRRVCIVAGGAGQRAGTRELPAPAGRPAHGLVADRPDRPALPGVVPVRPLPRAAFRAGGHRRRATESGRPPETITAFLEPRRLRRLVRRRLRGLDRREPAGRPGRRGRPLRPRGIEHKATPRASFSRTACRSRTRSTSTARITSSYGHRRGRRAVFEGDHLAAGRAPTRPVAARSGGATARTAWTRR